MDGEKTDSATQSKSRRCFPAVASVLIVTGILSVAYLIDKSVQGGGFLWWPYPAFALLVASIFTVHWFIHRDID